MRSVFKILLIPAALAFMPAISAAATAPPGNVPSEVRSDAGVTPAYHRSHHYRHYHYHYRPYRYYYRPYYRPYRYYYYPHCYWSRYWHRRICH